MGKIRIESIPSHGAELDESRLAETAGGRWPWQKWETTLDMGDTGQFEDRYLPGDPRRNG